MAKNWKLIGLPLLTFPFFLLPLTSYAQPQIDSASGLFVDGEQVTVQGVGFGDSGPDIVLFDDFEGVDGETVNAEAPIGVWESVAESAVYEDDGTGNISLRAYEDGTHRLAFDFPESDQVFFSYRVKTPTGYCFPNADEP